MNKKILIMTSYQKLKEENKNLRKDIYKIIDKDRETIFRYIMKSNMEDILMFGSLSKEKLVSDYKGLSDMITYSKNKN